MKLAAERWRSGILFEIAGGSATGSRGFGPQLSDDLAQWIVLSLAEHSLVQAATDTTAPVTGVRADSDAQERLVRLVGEHATAIAVAGSDGPGHVIVVGDPVGDSSVAMVEQLADALASACARLRDG